MKVILIAGKKRSGKDTFADMLSKEFEALGKTVEISKFADPMKRILAVTLGVTEEQLEDMKNNSQYAHRKYLQRFGSEGMKPYFGDDVWVKLMNKKIDRSDADIFLIPDFRFPIEFANLIKLPFTVNIVNKNLNVDLNPHISERALEEFTFSTEIDNSSTLSDLQKSAKTFAKKIKDMTNE